MAKRNIRKTDSETTNAPERRRTTAADGTAPTAPKAPRSRRKTEPAAAPAIGAAAAHAPEALTTVTDVESTFDEVTTKVPHEHIAVRAYHIYLSRGAKPGDQVADWITAERELREQIRAAR